MLAAAACCATVVPESAGARLAWLSVEGARAQVVDENLRDCLERVAGALAGAG